MLTLARSLRPLLPRRKQSGGSRRREGRGGLLTGLTMAQPYAFEHLDQVPHEVKTVANVKGGRCPLPQALGVAAVTIARGDLDVWMALESVRHDRDRAVGEQIDDPARL